MKQALPRIARTLLLTLGLAVALAATVRAPETLALTSPSGAPDLETVMSLQRLVCPGAVITGSFYEWRAVSKYRSAAGLHLGYDIAMPAGTRAVAGWPGQVTRVAVWYGAEHGVTVLSPSGYETTYGHISPLVKVGDVVNAGDPVGTVVNDHVDIKMRGPDGLYFDFGHATPPAVGVYPMPAPVRPTRADALRTYQMAWYSMQLDQEELKLARAAEGKAAAELDELRTRVRRSRADLPRLRQFLADGLVARIDVERAEADVRSGVSRVTAFQNQLRDAQRDVASRQARVRAMQAQLEAAMTVLSSMGISRGEVERKLRSPSSPQAVVQARELKQLRQRAQDRLGKAGSTQSVRAAQAEAERMQALYEQGVVSRLERDKARARYEAVRRSGS